MQLLEDLSAVRWKLGNSINSWIARNPRAGRFNLRLRSLKFTLSTYIFAAVFVLLTNVGWLVWSKFRYKTFSSNSTEGLDFSRIFHGDCQQAKRRDAYLHLLINFLSTLLLSGTNAFLAVYSSPTRAEIDVAHKKGKSVNVGIHNPRNFLHISKTKTIFCVVLIATSIPFSLIYNALVLTSTSANEYRWAIVSQGFLRNETFTLDDPMDSSHVTDASEAEGNTTEYSKYKAIQRDASTYERLDPQTCVQTYYGQFQSSRRNLLLVTRNDTGSSSVFRHGYSMFPNDFALSPVAPNSPIIVAPYSPEAVGEVSPNPCFAPSVSCAPLPIYYHKHHPPRDPFLKLYGIEVTYCLSERVTPVCSVGFNWTIMIIALICNTIKVLIFIFILVRIDVEKLLVTLGDTIGSFLTLEDPTTSGMCLMNATTKSSWTGPKSPVKYQGRSRKYFKYYEILPFRYLVIYIELMLVIITTTLTLIVICNQLLSSEAGSISRLGFGELSLQTLVFSGGSKLTSDTETALFANSPQLLLSVVYLVYQHFLTTFFLTRDFNTFGSKANTLMVSNPSGDQRDVWFFGMPFVPGLFVQTTQFVFHWVVSQAIFPVRVELFDADNRRLPKDSVLNNCSWSIPPMAVSVGLAALLMGVAWYFGTRKILGDTRPPLVGTSSAAISASCHYRPASENDAETMLVEKMRWGAVVEPSDSVGHCTIAPASEWDAGRMHSPVQGNLYA